MNKGSIFLLPSSFKFMVAEVLRSPQKVPRGFPGEPFLAQRPRGEARGYKHWSVANENTSLEIIDYQAAIHFYNFRNQMLTKSDIPLHICHLTSQTHISVEEIIFRDKIGCDFSWKYSFIEKDFRFWEGSPLDPSDSKMVRSMPKHFFQKKLIFQSWSDYHPFCRVPRGSPRQILDGFRWYATIQILETLTCTNAETFHRWV